VLRVRRGEPDRSRLEPGVRPEGLCASQARAAQHSRLAVVAAPLREGAAAAFV